MTRLTRGEFDALMLEVAEGWTVGDGELTLSAFAEDVRFDTPPEGGRLVGHEELGPYLESLPEDAFLRWHHLWFDEERQVGAGEYTRAAPAAGDHTGVAVVELDGGKISVWREYGAA